MAIQWVDTDDQLATSLSLFSGATWLAVDTEFERRTTFFAHAGLIQIGSADQVVLIDPLKINDWQPLRDVFKRTGIVMHSCSEDMDLFHHLLGEVPARVFDTQIAAAFAGYRPGIGFAALAEELLDIELDKSETRSDWLQRPLSPTQIEYAVNDAIWLARAYEALSATLGDRNEWVWQEGELLVSNSLTLTDPKAYLSRLTKAADLPALNQCVLAELSYWREQEARRRDMPRNRVLKETTLIELAKRLPDHVAQLSNMVDIHPGQIKRYADHWLAIIAEVSGRDNHAIMLERPLTRSEAKQYKKVMSLMTEQAQSLGLERETLVSKKFGQALTKTLLAGEPTLPDNLPEWRKPLYSKVIEAYLASQSSD